MVWRTSKPKGINTMKTLQEMLLEVTGNQELADKVSSALGEYMIPKETYRLLNEKWKAEHTEHETLKQSSMTAEEKHQLETKNLELMKKELGTKLNSIEVEKLFVAGGYAEADYTGLLGNIVSEDKDRSVAFATNLIATMTKQRENAISKNQEDMLNSNKNPTPGNTPTPTIPKPAITTF